MTTIKEIAQTCGVSVTTVSNVLAGKNKVSPETRQKILDEVKRTGYQPNFMAQGLRGSRTRTVGIIAEDICQFTTPGLLDGIMMQLEEEGYRATIKNLRLYSRWSDRWYDLEEKYRSVFDPAVQELLASRVDGIIHVAGHARVIPVYPRDLEKPVVMAYAYSESAQIPSIVPDDEQGGYSMTKYLLSKGHKRIGVLAGREDNIHSKLRIDGYRKALEETGLSFDPDLLVYANWNKQSGYAQTRQLLKQSPNLSAIFCLSDEMAGGALEYLRDRQIDVPGQISLAGFDNRNLTEYTQPALTSMQLPLIPIGKRSAQILLDKILLDASSAEQSEQVLVERIPCTIVERDSVTSCK
ncbi:MAG: LacI family transcriptional regulator [Lachnospiraceae bacterium]|nr:LacI family transcriptional regulator [Lachnospiraceae bacterium]